GRSLERDEASVRAFVQGYVERLRRRDDASLGAMFAEGVDCVSVGVGKSILVGSEAMRAHYKRQMPALQSMNVNVHDWHVLVFAGGQAACAVGQIDADQTLAEDDRQVSYRGTRVSIILEKQGDAWRVVHMHSSLPVGGSLDTFG